MQRNTRIRVRLFVLFQNLRPLLFRQLSQHDFIRAIRHFTHKIIRWEHRRCIRIPIPLGNLFQRKPHRIPQFLVGVIPRCNRLIIPAEKLVEIRFPAKGKKYNLPLPVLSGGCEKLPAYKITVPVPFHFEIPGDTRFCHTIRVKPLVHAKAPLCMLFAAVGTVVVTDRSSILLTVSGSATPSR